MQMAKVVKCEISDCSYNMDKLCHTMAITIGDGMTPMCDTYCNQTNKGGDAGDLAGVGACKVDVCKHNVKLECQAPGITVGYRGREPDCMTFHKL